MHAVSNRLLQIQVSAPLVEYRSNVARVLETSVVATQENICSVGVDGKLIIFMHQDDLLKDILVGYCSHLSFRQLKRLYKARAAVRPRCLKVASAVTFRIGGHPSFIKTKRELLGVRLLSSMDGKRMDGKCMDGKWSKYWTAEFRMRQSILVQTATEPRQHATRES
jgi:hypothetical protein